MNWLYLIANYIRRCDYGANYVMRRIYIGQYCFTVTP